VINALDCNARGHEFRPSFGNISKIPFLKSIVSDTKGLKMVRVTLQELTVTDNVSSDNWYKITLLPRWIAIINNRQNSYTHTRTLAHTIVVG